MTLPSARPLNTRALLFIALIFSVLIIGILLQQLQQGEIEEQADSLRTTYTAAERIPEEVRYRIRRNWSGKGKVLVGRVIEPPYVEVSRRATIEDDGSFATAVYPGRALEFYAHGYEPLVIEDGEHITGSAYDTGEHRFEKAPPKRLRQLTGSIAAEAGHSSAPEIELLLNIPNDATVSRDHGHWQHRNEPTAEQQALEGNGSFSFEGLSPIPYELVIRANGYIEQRIEIDPMERGTISLGEITLPRAKTLRFRYVSLIQINEPNEWPPTQTMDILCNGRKQFQFTDSRDKHRNRMRLRLHPEDGGVEAGFAWVPAEYYDLGAGNLENFRTGERKVELGKPISDRRLPLNDGHVYFFRHKGKDVNCLFAVEELLP